MSFRNSLTRIDDALEIDVTNLTSRLSGTGSGAIADDAIPLAKVSDSETNINTYTTTVLRNAATDTVWNAGDLAIVTGSGTYAYTGTDQTTAGVTVDSDWTAIVTEAEEGVSDIGDLDDVTISGAEDNQFLRYDGSGWINETVQLNGLANVITSSRTEGQVLTWDATNSIWVNRAIPTVAAININTYTTTALRNAATDTIWVNGDLAVITDFGTYVYTGTNQTTAGVTVDGDWTLVGASDLTGLDDVAISSPASNQILRYQSTGWENVTISDFVTLDSLGSVDITTTTPVDGHVLTFDGTNWVNEAPAGVDIATVSDDAPTNPSEGDLWYYTGGDDELGNTPSLFVYVNDGTTSAWITTATNAAVPNAPEAGDDDTSYQLEVASDGSTAWIESAAAEIGLGKETGAATIVASQTDYAIGDFTDTTSSDALTSFSPMRMVFYNGLALIEGVDYSISGTTLTLSSGVPDALTTGESLYLVNTTANVT